MARKYFGTDGIRGQANAYPMTPDIAMKVGMAVGLAFKRGTHRNRVVIGKDTRLSGCLSARTDTDARRGHAVPLAACRYRRDDFRLA